MGTRNLTMVIKDSKVKIAQYGQWDGYPGGQGTTILSFLNSTDLKLFSSKLDKVRFANKEDEKERELFLKKLGSRNGWVTMEQGKKFDSEYPLDSRDHGGKILSLVYNSSKEEIVLINNEMFAKDSLFCEYAYVIDLDKNTFEVYEGYNKNPLKKSDRFYYLQDKKKDSEYYPVVLVKEFDLLNLPNKENFLNEFKTEDETEDVL